MTMTMTKMKIDYTSLNPGERNYWIRTLLLVSFVGLAYYSCSIYSTSNNNTNSDIINAVNNAPSVVAATTSLVRGGGVTGDGEQEDLSSTSVGDSYVEIKTNSFVEEGGGLLGDEPCDCFDDSCYHGERIVDDKGCNGQGRCFWYPHGNYVQSKKGYCSKCSGVNCGAHRAPICFECLQYDNSWKGKNYCNGECEWSSGFLGIGGDCVKK